MPSVATESPLAVLSNSANSSFDGHHRKSNDKTIGGVFTYTNGTDVETGLPEHRLDQLKNLRANSNGSLTNGVSNGIYKGGWDSNQSRNSVGNSVGTAPVNATPKHTDSLAKGNGAVDGSIKLSPGDTTSTEQQDGDVKGGHKRFDKESLKVDVPLPRTAQHDPTHMVAASTFPELPLSASPSGSPQTSRTGPTPLSRFTSPNELLSPSGLEQSPEASATTETLPRLVHRHTLQIPRITTGQQRSSRDFSFTGAATEEALYATGRQSPSRDQEVTTPRHRRASLNLVRRATRSIPTEAQLDEVVPDEDAERWTEVIRQKRASRRRRREEEDDDRVIVGKKVEEGHVNWVTAYNMLTGIRFTVSRTNAKMDRELTDADFDAKHKFSFDVTGNELTPSAKYDFKFKDYSPWVFRHLRAIFGLDPADYLMSLTSKYILSELGSPGKSGSFFYFSRDYKYIIKTIHHAEHKLLRKILRDYYQHVVENPNTLISQFYGLHRVKIPYGRKIHFVVMNNLFPPHRDIHQTFDLKGSTIGRDLKEEDLANNPRATLKDLNWLRRDLHLEFNAQIRRLFIEQMQKDVALLQKLQIMDYSLLVGLHDLEKGNEENLRATTLKVFQPGGERDGEVMLTRTPSRLEHARKARELRLTLKKEKPVPMGMVSAKMPDEMARGDKRRNQLFTGDDGGIRAAHEDGSGGEIIYYLGIIDCLTHYGFIKRVENFWKSLSAPRNQISPIPPDAYGDRFVNFITGITMTKEEAERRKTNESQRQSFSHGSLSAAPQDRSLRLEAGHYDHDGIPYSPPHSPAAVDRTMRKAQKQADKATSPEKSREQVEDEKPDRILKTMTDEPKSSTLLPVVQEAGENGEGSDKGDNWPLPTPSHNGRVGTSMPAGGLRQVSASTTGAKEDTIGSRSRTNSYDREGSFKDTSPAYNHGQNYRDTAPQLDASIIPEFSPVYSSPRPIEPEKSVFHEKGRIKHGPQ